MTILFNWSIPQKGLLTMNTNGNADTVVRVSYIVTATDGTHSVETCESTELTPTSDTTFIPFAELTEAQVIAWVKASLPTGQESRIVNNLTRLLERKANPPVRPVAKAVPWNTCSQVQL